MTNANVLEQHSKLTRLKNNVSMTDATIAYARNENDGHLDGDADE